MSTAPNGGAFAGDTTNIDTYVATVPGWETQFVTNEEWACVTNTNCGRWVEGGDITGRGNPNIRYFAAYESPSGFVFNEYPNGPPLQSYFPVDTHTNGSTWWIAVGGEPVYALSGIGAFSDTIEAGLEETENKPINYGFASPLLYWNAFNGEKHEGWTGFGVSGEAYANRPACAEVKREVEVRFTANNCSFGPLVAPAVSATATAPPPGASYTASTGSALSNAQLVAVAQKLASEDGESAPTEISAVHAVRRNALDALDPQSEVPSAAQAPSLATWMSGTSVLITMHGHFAPSVPQPKGSPAVEGTVLSAVVDARTGQLSGFSINNSGPSAGALSALGSVSLLG